MKVRNLLGISSASRCKTFLESLLRPKNPAATSVIGFAATGAAIKENAHLLKYEDYGQFWSGLHDSPDEPVLFLIELINTLMEIESKVCVLLADMGRLGAHELINFTLGKKQRNLTSGKRA